MTSPDKKGPGPKKKILVRKSTETREPYIADDPKESPLPEKKYGEGKYNYSEEELQQRRDVLSGSVPHGEKYASAFKKLTPLTESESKEATKSLEKIPSEQAGYYVDKTLGYTGGASRAGAITEIDAAAKAVDPFKVTSIPGIRALWEGPQRKEMLRKSGLTEQSFAALTDNGSDKGITNFYYSTLQRVNERRKKLEELKGQQSSVSVQPNEKLPAPESKVVEDGIDKAVRLVKDSKGVVRKQMKDTK
jgi:hypothetical protein